MDIGMCYYLKSHKISHEYVSIFHKVTVRSH